MNIIFSVKGKIKAASEISEAAFILRVIMCSTKVNIVQLFFSCFAYCEGFMPNFS